MSEGRFVIERVLEAAPEAVFAAWGDPASLSVWMCPAPSIRSATVELDFRVGGRFRIAMHGERGDFVQQGEYLVIEPPKRIVMEWRSEWMPEAERRTRLRVELEPAGARRTRLVLIHEELPAGTAYDAHPAGWAEILRRLEAHLRRGAEPCP